MIFYIYTHTRKDTGEVFYIGKGNGKRAWDKLKRNNHWNNITNKTDYDISIVFESTNELDVLEKEVELIRYYGRKDLGLGNLVNLTNGGEGACGRVVSVEQREKISEYRKKNKLACGENNPMYGISRFGIENPMYGKKHTNETKMKISKQFKDGRYKGSNNPMHGVIRRLGDNPNSKIVIDTYNGIYYSSAKEVYLENNFSFRFDSFTRMLSGVTKNKTRFKYA